MTKRNLERPEAVLIRVPEIEDICIEFGIDRNDAETITYMYEVYKRCTGEEKVDYNDEAYDEGYKEGYNDAIEEAESKIDAASWEIGRLKKK